MEAKYFCVQFVTNKTYVLKDNICIHFKFKNQNMKIKYLDWIALYKRSNNRNFEDFVVVEIDLINHTLEKNGLYSVIFYENQLKSVECNEEYEFIYGSKFNQIYGKSCSLRFIHNNRCAICNPNVLEKNLMQIKHCDSYNCQEMINSLSTRIAVMDSQLNKSIINSTEIMSHNEHLAQITMDQIDECKAVIQKTSYFLENLFYTNEQVTTDGYRCMQPCCDIDTKMNLIESQERIFQDLSNLTASLEKLLEKAENKNNKNENDRGTQTDDSYLLVKMKEDRLLDTLVNIEVTYLPKPSTAAIVFIENDEDEFESDHY